MHRQNGNMALIIVLAILGFSALVGAFLIAGKNSTKPVPAAIGGKLAAEYQERIERALANSPAMQYTLERNSSQFNCLFSPEGNCTGQGGLIQLFESASLQAFALSQVQSGFGISPEGQGCRNYPSFDCPLRVEAVWSPVCAANGCNSVKSYRLKVNLSYQSGVEKIDWSTEKLFSPQINLSARAQCLRQGGIYTGTGCLQPGENLAQTASTPDALPSPVGMTLDQSIQFRCPDTILVQGESYLPDYDDQSGRAEVRVPAINNCPTTDSFYFQCVAKNTVNGGSDRLPASGDEGQWMQIDARLAAACDENGHPIDGQIPHIMEEPPGFQERNNNF